MQAKRALGAHEFVDELEARRDEMLQIVRNNQLGRLAFGDTSIPPQQRPQLAVLLKSVVYPERRVPDVLAKRMNSIPDFDIRARVADQIAEEINHARHAQRMLTKWGHDPEESWRNPIQELVHIFDYIESLETLPEFFSTFLIGEGLFLSTYLEDMQSNDPKAFSPYLEVALADEPAHIALAREALHRYAVTPELQEKARVSALKLLRMFLNGYCARIKLMQAEMVEAASSARGN